MEAWCDEEALLGELLFYAGAGASIVLTLQEVMS